MRILIADSDVELLDSLQSCLRKRGHDVHLTSDELDCATLRGFVPDVMVLDEELLQRNGDGFISALRDDPMLADVPVILIADSETQFDAQAGTNVVDWLQKPFLLGDLLLKILSTTAHLQPAGGLSESKRQITTERCHDENRALLPHWINPLRINTRHQRTPDQPR